MNTWTLILDEGVEPPALPDGWDWVDVTTWTDAADGKRVWLRSSTTLNNLAAVAGSANAEVARRLNRATGELVEMVVLASHKPLTFQRGDVVLVEDQVRGVRGSFRVVDVAGDELRLEAVDNA